MTTFFHKQPRKHETKKPIIIAIINVFNTINANIFPHASGEHLIYPCIFGLLGAWTRKSWIRIEISRSWRTRARGVNLELAKEITMNSWKLFSFFLRLYDLLNFAHDKRNLPGSWKLDPIPASKSPTFWYHGRISLETGFVPRDGRFGCWGGARTRIHELAEAVCGILRVERD